MPIYPIGIIDESEDRTIRFSIPPQNGRPMPKAGDPVTVWNQFNPPRGPLAKLTGEVTEASERTGTLIVHHTDIDPNWPQTTEPFGMGNPVYIAQNPGSYDPDPYREWASPEEFALMNELAKDHERQADIPPSGAAMVAVIEVQEDEDQDGYDGDDDLFLNRRNPGFGPFG